MQFYYSLEILRGVGALMVMLLHFNRMVEPYAVNSFSEWIEVSSMGVDYFFVLSGFLMYYIYQDRFGSREGVAGYYARRVARIYPMFWVSVLIMSALIPLSDSLSYPPATDIAKHVFLIKPNIDELGNGRILGVGWTLEIEMIFYFLFGLTILIKSKRVRQGVAGGLLVLTLVEPYFLLFYFGMLAGWLKVNKPNLFKGQCGSFVFSFGLCVSVSSELLLINEVAQKIGFGVGFLLMIMGLIRIEKSIENFKSYVPKWCTLLGSASYTVYLLHIPIGTILLKLALLSGLNRYVDAWLIVSVMTGISLLFLFFISEKVEMPMNKFFIQWIKSKEAKRISSC